MIVESFRSPERSGPTAETLTSLFLIVIWKWIPKYDGASICIVMCGADERDRSLLHELAQPSEFGWVLTDFRAVPPLKFRPALGGVSEPFPRLRAGSDRFHPFIDRDICLLHSARPQPVYENSAATFGDGRLVRPFELDAVGRNPPAYGCVT